MTVRAKGLCTWNGAQSLGGVQLSATELVGLGEFPGFEPEHVGMRTRQEFSCANS